MFNTLPNLATSLGVELPESVIPVLEAYHRRLVAKNAEINLTAVRDDEEALLVHYLDAFAGWLAIDAYSPSTPSILDLGTGGGFPGIPLAALLPEFQVYLVESRERKSAALREIAEHEDLPNVQVLHSRGNRVVSNELLPPNSIGVVTARAVAPLEDLVRETRELLAPGGLLVAWKGPGMTEDEERRGDRRAQRQKWRRMRDIKYTIPTDPVRNLRLVTYKSGAD